MKTWRKEENSLGNNINAWQKESTPGNLNSTSDIQGISTFRRRHSLFCKVVAFTVIIAFIVFDITWAQGGTAPVWQHAKPENIESQVKGPNGLTVPYATGTAQDVYINGSKQTIINIQDAHASLAAQKSIVSLLDHMVANYDLNLIAVEGSEGYIDTSILRAFPDAEARKQAAEYLMKEGLMSAGEFFSIVSDEDVALYGIESDKLYQENVTSFRNVMEERARLVQNVEALERALRALEEKVYSKELKDFLLRSYLHKEKGLSFSEYWKHVKEIARKKKIDFNGYKNIDKLLTSLMLEEKIDFSGANDERRILIDELSKVLTKSQIEMLVMKSLSFKMGEISQGAFHQFLIDLALQMNIASEPFENLIMFTRYITVYESIDIFGLYQDVEKVEKAVREKLFANKNEKTLYELQKQAAILRKLYSIELANGDVDYLITSRKDIKAEPFASFIRSSYKKHGLVLEGDYDLTYIIDNIDQAVEFYQVAKRRDEAMLKNTIARMKDEGQSVAALITGGFHTEGLVDIMKSKGLSYLVVVPKYEDEKERPYVAVLTGKTQGYEELVKKGKYELAVRQYYADGDPKRFTFSMILAAMGVEAKELAETLEVYETNYANLQESMPDARERIRSGKIWDMDSFRLVRKQLTPAVQEALRKISPDKLNMNRAIRTVINARKEEIELHQKRRPDADRHAKEKEELKTLQRLIYGDEEGAKQPSPVGTGGPSDGEEASEKKITTNTARRIVRNIIRTFFPSEEIPQIKINKNLRDRFCEFQEADARHANGVIFISSDAFDSEGRLKEEVKLFDIPHETFHAMLSGDTQDKNAEELAAIYLALLNIMTNPTTIREARANRHIQKLFESYGMNIKGDLEMPAGLAVVEDYRDLVAGINQIGMYELINMLTRTNPRFRALKKSDEKTATAKEAARIISAQKKILTPLNELTKTGTERQQFLNNPYWYAKRVKKLKRKIGKDVTERKGFLSLLGVGDDTAADRYDSLVTNVPEVSTEDEGALGLLTINKDRIARRKEIILEHGFDVTIPALRKTEDDLEAMLAAKSEDEKAEKEAAKPAEKKAAKKVAKKKKAAKKVAKKEAEPAAAASASTAPEAAAPEAAEPKVAKKAAKKAAAKKKAAKKAEPKAAAPEAAAPKAAKKKAAKKSKAPAAMPSLFSTVGFGTVGSVSTPKKKKTEREKKADYLVSLRLMEEKDSIDEAIDEAPDYRRDLLRNLINNDDLKLRELKTRGKFLQDKGINIITGAQLLDVDSKTLRDRHKYLTSKDVGLSGSEDRFYMVMLQEKNDVSEKVKFLKDHGMDVTVENLLKSKAELEAAIPLPEKKANYLVSLGLLNGEKPYKDALKEVTPARLKTILTRIVNDDNLTLEDLKARAEYLQKRDIEINAQSVELLELSLDELKKRYDFLNLKCLVSSDEKDFVKLLKTQKETVEEKYKILKRHLIPVTVANLLKSKKAIEKLIPLSGQKADYLASLGLIDAEKMLSEAISEKEPEEVRKAINFIVFNKDLSLKDLQARAKKLQDAGIEINDNTVFLLTKDIDFLTEKIKILTEDAGLTGKEDGFVELLSIRNSALDERCKLLKRHGLDVTVENLKKNMDELKSMVDLPGQKADILARYGLIDKNLPIEEALEALKKKRRPKALQDLLRDLIYNDDISVEQLNQRLGHLQMKNIKINSKTAHLLGLDFHTLFERSYFLEKTAGFKSEEVDFTPLLDVAKEELEKRYNFLKRYNLPVTAENMLKSMDDLRSMIPLWGKKADYLASLGLLSETGTVDDAIDKAPEAIRDVLKGIVYEDELSLEDLKERAEFLKEKNIAINADTAPLLTEGLDTLKERYDFLTGDELQIRPEEKEFPALMKTPKEEIAMRRDILKNYELPVTAANLAKDEDGIRQIKTEAGKKADYLAYLGLDPKSGYLTQFRTNFRNKKMPIREAVDAISSKHYRKLFKRIIYSADIQLSSLNGKARFMQEKGITLNVNTLFLLTVNYASLEGNYGFLTEEAKVKTSEKGFATLLAIPEAELHKRLGFLQRYKLPVNAANLGKTLAKLEHMKPLWGKKADYLASLGLMDKVKPISEALGEVDRKYAKYLAKVILNDRISLEELEKRAENIRSKNIEITPDTAVLLVVDFWVLNKRYELLTNVAGLSPDQEGFKRLLSLPHAVILKRLNILKKYGVELTPEYFIKSLREIIHLFPLEAQKRVYFASLGLIGSDLLKSLAEVIGEAPGWVKEFFERHIADDSITLKYIKKRIKFLRRKGFDIRRRRVASFMSLFPGMYPAMTDLEIKVKFLENLGIQLDSRSFPLLFISLKDLYKSRNAIIESGLEMTAKNLKKVRAPHRSRAEVLARLRRVRTERKNDDFDRILGEKEAAEEGLRAQLSTLRERLVREQTRAKELAESAGRGITHHEKDHLRAQDMVDALKTHIANTKKELEETQKGREKFYREQGIKSRLEKETGKVTPTRDGLFANLIPEHMNWLKNMHRIAGGAYRLIAKPEEVIVTSIKKESEEGQAGEPEETEIFEGTSIPVAKGIFTQVVDRLESLKRYIAGEAVQRPAAEAETKEVKKMVEDNERFYANVVSRFDVWAELKKVEKGRDPLVTEAADELVRIACEELSRHLSEAYGLKGIEWLTSEPIPFLEHLVIKIIDEKRERKLTPEEKADIRMRIDTRMWELFTTRRKEFTDQIRKLFSDHRKDDPFMRDFVLHTVLKEKMIDHKALSKDQERQLTGLSAHLQEILAEYLTAYYEKHYLDAKLMQLKQLEDGGVEAREKEIDKLTKELDRLETEKTKISRLIAQIEDYRDRKMSAEEEIGRLKAMESGEITEERRSEIQARKGELAAEIRTLAGRLERAEASLNTDLAAVKTDKLREAREKAKEKESETESRMAQAKRAVREAESGLEKMRREQEALERAGGVAADVAVAVTERQYRAQLAIEQAKDELRRAEVDEKIEALQLDIDVVSSQIAELKMESMRLLRNIDSQISPSALEEKIKGVAGKRAETRAELNAVNPEETTSLAALLKKIDDYSKELSGLEKEKKKGERMKADIRSRAARTEKELAELDHRIEEAKQNLIEFVHSNFEPEFYRIREEDEESEWEDVSPAPDIMRSLLDIWKNEALDAIKSKQGEIDPEGKVEKMFAELGEGEKVFALRAEGNRFHADEVANADDAWRLLVNKVFSKMLWQEKGEVRFYRAKSGEEIVNAFSFTRDNIWAPELLEGIKDVSPGTPMIKGLKDTAERWSSEITHGETWNDIDPTGDVKGMFREIKADEKVVARIEGDGPSELVDVVSVEAAQRLLLLTAGRKANLGEHHKITFYRVRKEKKMKLDSIDDIRNIFGENRIKDVYARTPDGET
ncbi:MAG: hypothetical protein WBC00_07330, partial [Candidatus Omnitrophota bacterium]